MQPNTKVKRGLINDDVTTHTDFIKTGASSPVDGYHVIINSAGAQVIPPIPKGRIMSISFKESVVEKQQYVLVSDDAETIVAAKRYAISMQFPKDRPEGSTHDFRNFAVEAPATLSGNAVTDRANIYDALNNKINAYVPTHTKAKLANVINTKSTGARTITAGTLIYLKTPGTFVGMVAKTVVAGADTTDLALLVIPISGTFPSGGTDIFCLVSNSGTEINKTSTAYVLKQGLVIYDEAGYFATKGRLGRGSAPTIFTRGFNYAVSLMQAHSYSNGVGDDMLANTPEFNQTFQGVDRGDFDNQYVTMPIAGTRYTEYTVKVLGGGIPDAIDGRSADIPIEHILYVKEGTPGTAMANFKNAFIALT
jgi:hypothetical protein